ncbi:invasion associated locus B family protein [Rhodobacterales bacterium HKCCE3408]|nr:invasion associated locus B family protein [Rhodobacterales bacterium HKCCE3408]
MTFAKWLAPATMAGLIAALPALAQEDLAIGVPEGTGAAPGADDGSFVAATHDDWEVRCVDVPDMEADFCQMYQLLTDSSGNPVAEVNFTDLPDAGEVVAGATIVTPLDTLLTVPLRIQIGTREPLLYPYRFCQPIGCFVRIGLTQDNLDAYRAGAEATVTLVPFQAPDQTVELMMSLAGFTAAFDDVAERTATLQAEQEAAAAAADE